MDSVSDHVCLSMLRKALESMPPPNPPTPTSAPNWDAMANSFAGLSMAFAWGSTILAVVAFISALGWGWIVKSKAEREAREEAKKCAEDHMRKWTAETAPGIVRQYMDGIDIQNLSIAQNSDQDAADEMGVGAG